MTIVPLAHSDSTVRTAIKRGLSGRGAKVRICRTTRRVGELLRQELVDAVVVDVRNFGAEGAIQIVKEFPRIPVFALSAFRPDDGPLISRCRAAGVRGILVEGVDEGVAGEVIASCSATQLRRMALRDAPRLLRLTETVQLDAWELVLRTVGSRIRTADIARRLHMTREHLSREFAAGGAPNLKRVIDLVRSAWAADLLANPGYTVRTVSQILKFSSPSHLAGSAKRIAGVTPKTLAALGPRGVLQRFVRGRTRSRL